MKLDCFLTVKQRPWWNQTLNMDKHGYVRMMRVCEGTQFVDGEARVEGVSKNDTRGHIHIPAACEYILICTLNKLKLHLSIIFIDFLLSDFLFIHRMTTKNPDLIVNMYNNRSKKLFFDLKFEVQK